MGIDPDATGMLYTCYEVLLSLASTRNAVLLLGFTLLLVRPVRRVLFERSDAFRPSSLIPAIAFGICMTFGRSYDLTNSAALALGSTARIVLSLIMATGCMLLALVAINVLYQALDRRSIGSVPRRLGAYLDRHPFIIPLVVLLIAWAPTFIASMPGIMMGDTPDQLRQWFGIDTTTSNYLQLIDPNVLLNGHHPVVHTALLGSLVEFGQKVLGDENLGLLLYTTLQFALTAAAVAHALAVLARLKVPTSARIAVLAFFVFVPLASQYAVTITKDTLFADALLILVAQMMLLTAQSPLPSSGAPARQGRARIGKGDWLLLMVGALGCAFLRNGGLVFTLAACLVVTILCWKRARMRAAGALAVCSVALGAYLAFTLGVMPALSITPGSPREALSIPFQQTARFVAKHDSAHAGVENGTDDGLVTAYERQVIDQVLDYETLASRYDPNTSDAVKNRFNEQATDADIAAYLRVWTEMFLKDPAAYLSASFNNYYGYFYPSEQETWMYRTASSDGYMEKLRKSGDFDLRPASGPVVDWCRDATNLYRTAIQHMPVLSLVLTSAAYTWSLLLLSTYLLRDRRWRALALLLPLWGVVGMCLIGPSNGATYLRYIYPLAVTLPFAAAANASIAAAQASQRTANAAESTARSASNIDYNVDKFVIGH